MDTARASAHAAGYQPDPRDYQIRVSAYDRAASLLLTLLTVMGLAVFLLLLIWASMKVLGSAPVAVPVKLEEIGFGEGEGGGSGGGKGGGIGSGVGPGEEGGYGDGVDFDAPAGDSAMFDEATPEQTLAAVVGAVAATGTMLDEPALMDQFGSGSGFGRGRGRGRGSGTGGGGGGGRPRKWEIEFAEGNTLDLYARQLDFFGIELGILMPGDQIAYAYHLSKPTPDRRTGPSNAENRYYLTWRRGDLEQADRELLSRAGVSAEGKLIFKFLPPQTEQTLARLERDKAGALLKDVRKTRFGVRNNGGGFAFYVIDQTIGFLTRQYTP